MIQCTNIQNKVQQLICG